MLENLTTLETIKLYWSVSWSLLIKISPFVLIIILVLFVLGVLMNGYFKN